MKDFVTSSALTRLLANIFIFLCLLVCLFIGAYQIVAGQQVSPICYMVVSTGMAYSLMLLGIHTGLSTIPVEEVNKVQIEKPLLVGKQGKSEAG